MTAELIEAIANRRAILFAGAGLSATLGVPTWRQLIAHIGQDLGYDSEIFNPPGTNYLTHAEFYRQKKGTLSDLIAWMKKSWNVADDELKRSIAHKAIVDMSFSTIYTTNYDDNLERSHILHGKSAKAIVDIADMAHIQPNDTAVVKFHGDLDRESSIVLTESHYFERLNFEAPLDIRLRSDALSKSILFVGYGLADVNVRLLLHKLGNMWAASGTSKAMPRSYIFQPRPDPIQEAVLEGWNIELLSSDLDNSKEALESFLANLARAVKGASVSAGRS